ncbi:peptide chain release factor N(5)-glutamine methyltransferase [Lacticigenium naphthae]|uniref:peptide chain release factor N(5)-glutamine methyltransferase n=1 Tax=Lacticigenium naphthae TaxID=515351 RepID=UPI00040E66AA|nr:peptide chain release factor N(5)-glutamine methyltransferase [Lacticigenium naphthae]
MNPDIIPNFQNKTYREVLRWASSFLESKEKEAAIAEWLMKEMLNVDKTGLIRKLSSPIDEKDCELYKSMVSDAAQGIPPQYIVGHEWFFDRKFFVNKFTLIPRPETEELVQLALQSITPEKNDVLDIGTGTGIIATTIKLEKDFAKVVATDISSEALEVAKRNRSYHQADIELLQGDLIDPVKDRKFDIIISNPPYIGENEIEEMDEGVLKFEPWLALFAEEEGISIYRLLAQKLPKILSDNGEIFLEIGYSQGSLLKELFKKQFPDKNIVLVKDLAGKDRILHIF